VLTAMDKTRLKADAYLLIAAVIWGMAFVAQRVAALEMGVFTFNGSRFVIGGAVLWLFFSLAQRSPLRFSMDRKGFLASLATGLVLFLGTAFQQAGLQSTTAANAGFITGLYVIFVPILLAAVLHRRVGLTVWLAAGLAVVGLLLLSTGGRLELNRGDVLELIGALVWALHVILVGWTVRFLPVRQYALAQFGWAALFNLLAALLLELPWQPLSANTWIPVLYVGIFSTAVGYTLQLAGQRHAPETDAAFLLNLEAAFAAVFGYLILRETLTPVQLVGCGLLLSAVLLAQYRPRPRPLTPVVHPPLIIPDEE
jgi:drug/metabolite transporter (DMT)-like permease